MNKGIVFDSVSKAYRSRGATSFKKILLTSDDRLGYGRQNAVEDICFSVDAGQAFGILGFNGAGKSTILRLALGTLIPDSGHVIRGERVGAMLALQAGLHPDFTGLENVLMKSAFHGISRKEAMALLPSIEEFSELGAAFYQPIRTYSSGMSARLAFSTLIAMRWDLLLIDEVLAVGDLQFQQKCLSAIDSYLDGGGTVVLVSHNPKTILSICATSMWVKKGRVGKVGPSREVVDLYREALLASELTALSPRVAK